jgi:endonuclease III
VNENKLKKKEERKGRKKPFFFLVRVMLSGQSRRGQISR